MKKFSKHGDMRNKMVRRWWNVQFPSWRPDMGQHTDASCPPAFLWLDGTTISASGQVWAGQGSTALARLQALVRSAHAFTPPLLHACCLHRSGRGRKQSKTFCLASRELHITPPSVHCVAQTTTSTIFFLHIPPGLALISCSKANSCSKSISSRILQNGLQNFMRRAEHLAGQSRVPKVLSAWRGPICCLAPRGHHLSAGDALSAPDRARSGAGSGGPDVALTHEHRATVAYFVMEVIGAQ
jgi:hypothetical protein